MIIEEFCKILVKQACVFDAAYLSVMTMSFAMPDCDRRQRDEEREKPDYEDDEKHELFGSLGRVRERVCDGPVSGKQLWHYWK